MNPLNWALRAFDAVTHPVDFAQNVARDYGAAVAVVSASLVALNSFSSALSFIPVANHLLTVAIAGTGALLASLKAHAPEPPLQ